MSEKFWSAVRCDYDEQKRILVSHRDRHWDAVARAHCYLYVGYPMINFIPADEMIRVAKQAQETLTRDEKQEILNNMEMGFVDVDGQWLDRVQTGTRMTGSSFVARSEEMEGFITSEPHPKLAKGIARYANWKAPTPEALQAAYEEMTYVESYVFSMKHRVQTFIKLFENSTAQLFTVRITEPESPYSGTDLDLHISGGDGGYHWQINQDMSNAAYRKFGDATLMWSEEPLRSAEEALNAARAWMDNSFDIGAGNYAISRAE